MKARKGHASWGGVILKGKPEGIGRSLDRTEGGGWGGSSLSEFEKRLGGGSAEGGGRTEEQSIEL